LLPLSSETYVFPSPIYKCSQNIKHKTSTEVNSEQGAEGKRLT